MSIGVIAALVYGALALVGGIIGYAQAGSIVSLISGGLSGVLLVLGGILWLQGNPVGAGLSMGVTVALVVVFIRRWMQTRKPMPAALMIATGAIAFVVMLINLLA